MQKNTTSILSSNQEHVAHAPRKSKKNNRKEAGPSKQTIQNILNFSKALNVEEKSDGGFIEYIKN